MTHPEKDSKAGSSDILGVMAAANALSAGTSAAASAFTLGQAPPAQSVASKWISLSTSAALCTFEPLQIAYLQDRLEASPVVRAYLSGNQDEVRAALQASIPASSGEEKLKVPEAAQTNASMYGLSFLWSASAASSSNSASPKRVYSLEEDLLDIAKFLEKLSLLRLSLTPDKRFTTKLGAGVPKSFNLSAFSNIKALELGQVQVASIADWSTFGPQLLMLNIHEGIFEK
ncbi:hypothetical protein BC829DRAFT_279680 [Chytridium lagenaria]|nr:hypothetical protein BC829DRAFT_279680 [Chytridium lagenaria]